MNSTPKTHWPTVFLYWAAGLGASMQFAKFSVIFEKLRDHYQAPPAEAGIALSIVGLAGMMFGATIGILAGRIGYGRILASALFLGALLSLMEGFLPPLSPMILLRAIEGVSHLCIVVAAPTMMIAAAAPHHRSIVMGIWGAFFGTGFALMGLIGGVIAEPWGIASLFFTHSIYMLALAGLIFQKNRRAPLSLANSHSGPLSITKILTENVEVYRNRKTAFPAFLFFFHALMFISLLTFTPLFTNDSSAKKLLVLFLPLISTLASFVAGIFAQYLLSPIKMSVVSFVLLAITSLWLWLSILAGASIIYPALMLLLASGLVQGALFSLVPYFTDEPALQSRSNGAISQLANFAGTVGTPFFAYMVETAGPAGLTLPIIFLALVAIVLLVFRRPQSDRPT